MKKKICFLLFTILFLFCMVENLDATDFVSCEIPDTVVKTTIDIPADYIVVTSDMTELPAFFNDYDITMEDLFFDERIELVSFPEDITMEIDVTVLPADPEYGIYNYNDYSKEELSELAESIDNSTINDYPGTVVSQIKSVTMDQSNSQAIFFILEGVAQDNPVLSGHTYVNGQIVNVAMYCYEDEISDAQRAIFAETIKSVSFIEIKETPAEYQQESILGSLDWFKILSKTLASVLLGAIVLLIRYLIHKGKKNDKKE